MFRSLLTRLLLGSCVISGCVSLSACGSGSAPQDERSVTGTLRLPLLTTVGAHTYRLQGGLYVNGPVFESLDVNADALSVSLPTGDYSAYLYTWQLTRDDGTGNFRPVAATLTSSANPSFSIYNGATSTVSFEFETDGQLVTIGTGALIVDIDVQETPAICSPLGDDCGDGNWCPPPELTGNPVSCVAAGPLAEGEACGSPLECAANTSCFDFGAGAHCVRLCDRTEFEQPCSSGGLCTAVGADYGVCVTAP